MAQESIQTGIFSVYEVPSPVTFKTSQIDLNASVDCFDIHLVPGVFTDYPEVKTRAAAAQSLTVLANYAVLRSELYDPRYVVGTTHTKIAMIAEDEFGFDRALDMPPHTLPVERERLLREVYNGEPALVWMSVPDLISLYADGCPTEFIRKAAEDRALGLS